MHLPFDNPTQRSFPELLDIGIMGHCHAANTGICQNAGVDCYQKAKKIYRSNMDLKNYIYIMKQSKNKVFQVALGGSGDPNKHESFESILKITRDVGIVPNLTTSGISLEEHEVDLIKEYCGAVAVSFYSKLVNPYIDNTETCNLTISAINRFIYAGCTTNIHYILSTDSVEEAVIRLKNDLFPRGINAVIFILYKPVGFGKKEKVLSINNSYFLELLKIIQEKHFNYEIGFDTCSTPALISLCPTIASTSIDFCEAARFSMYIDCEMNAFPCSFDCEKKTYKVSLNNSSIEQAWWSQEFKKFRKCQESACLSCKHRALCLGGCVLDFNLDICGMKYINK